MRVFVKQRIKGKITMDKWDFLNDIHKLYDVNIEIKDNGVSIINPNNQKHIDIYKDEYYSNDTNDSFIEYIVCFTTQHVHFENLSNVEKYVYMILKDEIFAIEFYHSNTNNSGFGGDIKKSDFQSLSLKLLSELWGHSIEYLSTKDYEIHSWSGKYDSGRRKVSDLDRE